MYIVFGHKLYGKTDVVPGFFHVATRFAHVYYIPLIPTGSFLVVGEADGKTFRGVPLSLSAKSVFLAWGRAACTFVALTCALMGFILGLDARHPDKAGMIVQLTLASAAFALLVGSYYVRGLVKASPSRAFSLAQQAGFSASGLELLRQHFGLNDQFSGTGGFPVQPAATAIRGDAVAAPGAPRRPRATDQDLSPIPLE